MKVFFIFSQYRTGSELLCSLLDSHPDVTCRHESLRPGRGEVRDWREIASEIHADRQTKFIGLHGHADWLTPDILEAATEKIALYRDDTVMSSVKQTLVGMRRVHDQFYLAPDDVATNYPIIKTRDELLFKYSTLQLNYEQLTGGESIRELDPKWSRRILGHIGARRQTLTTTLEKAPPMLPANLEEIYQNVETTAAG